MNRKGVFLAAFALSILLLPATLAAESRQSEEMTAIEEAMSASGGGRIVQGIDAHRAGSPEQTVPTPEDFPDAYDYGSGRISDFDRLSNFRHLPEPEDGATVLHAEVNPGTRKLDRLSENAGAARIALTESEVMELDRALDATEMSEVFGGSRIATHS